MLDLKQKKLLITGATGFLGAEIARLAILEGMEVYALFRSPKKKARLAYLKLTFVQGDVTDQDSLERALKGMDYAIHTAGDTSYDIRDLKRLEKINITGVRNFFQAAKNQKIKKIVHTSSVAAIGFSKKGEVVDETAHYNWPKDLPYMETKKKGEDIALEFAQAGMNVVIVNPATVLGPGPLNISEEQMVSELEQGKAMGIPGGGMSVCHLEDVARAHLQALARGKSGERYILSGPHVSHKEFYQVFAKHLKVKPPRLEIPNWILKLLGELARVLEKIGFSLGIPSAVLRLSPFKIYHSWDKASQALSYRSRSFDEIVASVVAYRKSELPLKASNSES